jgi:nucleoside-diphosphate-sugar epimerase
LTGLLVTGAEGFVGRELLKATRSAGMTVRAAVRDRGPDLQDAVSGVDAVIHLAARAHVVDERAHSPIDAFRAVNVDPTLRLFRACQASGVRRFVFVSSIGVNGVMTGNKAFSEGDIALPVEPYAVSKWEAECGLQDLASKGITELVIVRPSLIYGPHAKGNFARLLRLVRSGWPLPLGSIKAKRSILSVSNLCDLLVRCVRRPEAAGQVFVAADREPIATRDLIIAIADIMRRPARMLSIPPSILNLAGRLTGYGAEVNRLTHSLEVNSSKAQALLNWRNDENRQYDLTRMVETFLAGAP